MLMQPPARLDIPPDLLRRLKFRAYRQHRTLENEILRCLDLGLAQEEPRERFRDCARRLRQDVHGVLTIDRLDQWVNCGRD